MAENKKKMGGLMSFLLWLLLMSLALVSAARGEDRALLIGVGRYSHFDERLNGVSLDLRMMTELALLMGFKSHEIKTLKHEHASTARVYAAVENWLIKGAGPQDRVLFYFSGHGSQIPDENHDEKDQFDEVLLLHDVTLKQNGTQQTLGGVLVDDDFSTMLAKMKSRNILVIIDACHSGSATRSLRLVSRSLSVSEAQVKFFAYTPELAAAGGGGRFDVMEPEILSAAGGNYVAITACRDNEKTVATAQGSIFTLALRQVVRSAAMAKDDITPEEVRHKTTNFIRAQLQSSTAVFHPQIAGNKHLRERPLQLVSLSGGNGYVRAELKTLVNKSDQPVWLKLNKTCFEPGDALELSIWIPQPGYLNVIGLRANDQAMVLFPNQYHPYNAVGRGKLTLPGDRMDFEMVAEGVSGPNLITAFLTRSPLNSYKYGFKSPNDVLASLAPGSTRSLIMRQRQEWLAAGSIAAEIRQKGKCPK